jgi:hypothetical protein
MKSFEDVLYESQATAIIKKHFDKIKKQMLSVLNNGEEYEWKDEFKFKITETYDKPLKNLFGEIEYNAKLVLNTGELQTDLADDIIVYANLSYDESNKIVNDRIYLEFKGEKYYFEAFMNKFEDILNAMMYDTYPYTKELPKLLKSIKKYKNKGEN